MRITARAKINWTLDILGRRPDGYHEIDTILQPIALCDTIHIERADGLSFTADGMAAEDANLVLKAARSLREACGIASGARIHLVKRIPIGAGLGGGSADAAATLKALNILWVLRQPQEKLMDIARTLGADVPYCVYDHAARARGIGERLSPVASRIRCPLVLIQPCEGLMTKDVFSRYSPLESPLSVADAAQALKSGDLPALALCAGNALMPSALSLRPSIRQALDDLMNHGAVLAQMTGSGSAVFGAFDDMRDAERAYHALKEKYAAVIITETAV